MTAENRAQPHAPVVAFRASMRPRPMTAENLAPSGETRPRPGGFNEAAADDRGKPRTRGRRSASAPALQ